MRTTWRMSALYATRQSVMTILSESTKNHFLFISFFINSSFVALIRCEKIPKRRCRTSYKDFCKVEKKCHTITKKKCTKIPKKQCQDVKDCQTKYRKECKKPTYSYGQTCKKIPYEVKSKTSNNCQPFKIVSVNFITNHINIRWSRDYYSIMFLSVFLVLRHKETMPNNI